MKKLFIGLLLASTAVSVNANAAITLFCEASYNGYTFVHGLDADRFRGLVESVHLNCGNTKLKKLAFVENGGFDVQTESFEYDAEIEGRGLQLSYILGEQIVISCPTVRNNAMGVTEYTNKRGITKKGVTEFYGAKASAGVVVGADAGVFVNKRGGACVLLGLQAGFGFGVSGAKLTIKNKRRGLD